MPADITWDLALWLGVDNLVSLVQTCSYYSQTFAEDALWRLLYRHFFGIRQVESANVGDLPDHFWRQLTYVARPALLAHMPTPLNMPCVYRRLCRTKLVTISRELSPLHSSIHECLV